MLDISVKKSAPVRGKLLVDTKALCTDYTHGATIPQLIAKYKVHRCTVHNHLKLGGVPMRTTKKLPAPTSSNRSKCVHCGDPFVKLKEEQTCCNKDCATEYERSVNPELHTCLNCFYPMPRARYAGSASFCSPRCEDEWGQAYHEKRAKQVYALYKKEEPTILSVAVHLTLTVKYVSKLIKDHCPHCSAKLIKGKGKKRCGKCCAGAGSVPAFGLSEAENV